MISFAVACVSTALQGLIAHAFRQTIGDIIVTANSLGDVEHIKNIMLTDPEHNTDNGSSPGTQESVFEGGRYPLHTAMDTHTKYKRHHTTTYNNKRFDARGFFQSIPTNMKV